MMWLYINYYDTDELFIKKYNLTNKINVPIFIHLSWKIKRKNEYFTITIVIFRGRLIMNYIRRIN